MKSKFHSEQTVQKARSLKRKGLSAREIGRRLKVSANLILNWCTDIPSYHPYHIYARTLRNKAQQRSVNVVHNIRITKESAKTLASILYWCEGSKYPSTNFVSFANSDIELVKTFLKLFRLGFGPKENKLRVLLQLHTTHNKKEMKSFWSKLLHIPEPQFFKPTITRPTKNMKRKNYKGTCTIRYYDVYLLHEIVGVYESFLKKIDQLH